MIKVLEEIEKLVATRSKVDELLEIGSQMRLEDLTSSLLSELKKL